MVPANVQRVPTIHVRLCEDYRAAESALQEGPLDFVLNEKEPNTVKELIDKLTSPSLLALPRSTGQCTAHPDAPSGQIGGVLLQKQKHKQVKPMEYWLRFL